MRIKPLLFLCCIFLFQNALIGQTGLNFDCYKLIIEKCPTNFLPMGGDFDADVVITARIENDCGSNTELSGYFEFCLQEVSTEPGYCLNAPKNLPADGLEDSKTWKDLQFPDQTGFTISQERMVATCEAGNNLTEKSVTVRSFDYGAYGEIRVSFIGEDVVLVGKEESNETQDYTRIPLDDDGNFIADNAPYGLNTGSPTDDIDNQPAGNGVDGDGVVKWEEYRGFEHIDDQHFRLSPETKDIFITVHNPQSTGMNGIGWVTTSNLGGVEVHEIANNTNLSSKITNFRSKTYNAIFNEGGPNNNQIYTVYAIVVTGASEIESPDADEPWGIVSGATVNKSPSNYYFCRVNYSLINSGSELKYPMDLTADAFQVQDVDVNELWKRYYYGGGRINIEEENIIYANRANQYFSGCQRGSNAVSHSPGEIVDFFVTPLDAVNKIFAHEVGHVINLEHCADNGTDHSIMNRYISGGAIIGNPDPTQPHKTLFTTYIGNGNCGVFNTLQAK